MLADLYVGFTIRNWKNFKIGDSDRARLGALENIAALAFLKDWSKDLQLVNLHFVEAYGSLENYGLTMGAFVRYVGLDGIGVARYVEDCLKSSKAKSSC